MFGSKIKVSIIGLALLCLTPSMGYSQDCPTKCADFNGDNSRDVADLVALGRFLHGGPGPFDSSCAEVDPGIGITICDWAHLMDWTAYIFNQWLYCSFSFPTYDYLYLPTPEDTVFFPSMPNIPETVDRVELPIFISYFNRSSPEGVYLPFLPLGQGSGSAFVPDNPDSAESSDTIFVQGIFYDIKPDTALNMDLRIGWPNDPTGRVLSGVIHYRRVGPGVGQLIPEIVEEFDQKRMALAKLDSTDGYQGNLYIPTIKSYVADPCCLGGGGNIDCDPNDNVDIADLTMLIDHLFIGFDPLCCRSEANVDVDTDVTVDMSDLTMLIDHLFISFAPIQSCQTPYLDD